MHQLNEDFNGAWPQALKCPHLSSFEQDGQKNAACFENPFGPVENRHPHLEFGLKQDGSENTHSKCSLPFLLQGSPDVYLGGQWVDHGESQDSIRR
ncbi:MAG: hypothetical protein FJ404_05030 [Verrucomicrobia bacterium]|nr:hypothetical protein [Verrucomicrobiota bacterium]